MAVDSGKVEALIAAGQYTEAAEAARALGDHLRAAGLYERIWEFAKAARCAREGGDLVRALRNAIDGGDAELTADLQQAIHDRGAQAWEEAMVVLAKRRRFAEAARWAEKVGRRDLAVEYYQRSHLDLEAARLLDEEGCEREAGRLLQRLLGAGGSDETMAEAHLRLGLLLARQLRHQEAARHLQAAAAHSRTRDRAQAALVVELAALGLRSAAQDVLQRARQTSSSLPATVDDVLRLSRNQAPEKIAAPPCDSDVVAGRYRLEALLGSGGTGRVFRAVDEVSGKTVAVKLFSAAHLRGKESYERFAREARVTASLHHANLVKTWDFSLEHGFLVMEYMVGGSLAQRLAPGLGEAATRRVGLDVLAGLQLAHQRGIIHRDIKPANIFFAGRGRAKLGDFGVAHLLDLGQTQTGGLIGTLAYMSPEQITGSHLAAATDLYGLGVTLFQCLTGRLPFLGPDFVAQHLGAEPPSPTALAPDISPAWNPLLARLLAKAPGDRYAAAEDLERDLRAMKLVEANPMLLPRAASATGPRICAAPREQDSTGARAATAVARYQHETSIGSTSISQLSRAVDASLNRSVIIERFHAGAELALVERRLYALARRGGPFLQRALSYDRADRVAVYEAPAGIPMAETYRDRRPSPRPAIRLVKRLARAVAPVHQDGHAHGCLDAARVLVDEAGYPTLLVAGLGPMEREPEACGDVAAILRLVIAALRGTESGTDLRQAFLGALALPLAPREREALLAPDPPATGEELYGFAEALEVAVLQGPRTGAVKGR